MEKFKGTIKAKKKVPTKVRRAEVQEEDDHGPERFMIDVIKKLTGLDVTSDTLKAILTNLQIDLSRDLSDDDLLLIYNLLTEPMVAVENERLEYISSDMNREEYEDRLKNVSGKFMDVLANQRTNGIYLNLPSLEKNRLNFEIEKDIFRNKPLLGKGIFKCGKCGSDDTEDWEKQTRSADEPMTVFVRCRNCNARFRFG